MSFSKVSDENYFFTNYSQGDFEEKKQREIEDLQKDTTIALIPTFIYLSVVAIAGCFGNTLALFVHFRKLKPTALGVLIINVTCYDLCGNVFVIPFIIYDILHQWEFQHEILCQIKNFLLLMVGAGASLNLALISLARYRKICQPFSKQWTITKAKYSSMFVFVVSLILSAVFACFHGIQEKPTGIQGIKGKGCGIVLQLTKSLWSKVYMLDIVLLYVGVCCLIFVTNLRIFLKTRQRKYQHKKVINNVKGQNEKEEVTVLDVLPKQTSFSKNLNENIFNTKNPFLMLRKKRPEILKRRHSFTCLHSLLKIQFTSRRSLCTEDVSFIRCKSDNNKTNSISYKTAKSQTACSLVGCLNLNENVTLFGGSDAECVTPGLVNLCYHYNMNAEHRTQFVTDSNIPVDPTRQVRCGVAPPAGTLGTWNRGKHHIGTGRTTYMLLTISLVYFLGYLPTLGLTFYRFINPVSLISVGPVPFSLFHLFLRSYLINTCINPVLFNIFNLKFRSECKKILRCFSQAR